MIQVIIRDLPLFLGVQTKKADAMRMGQSNVAILD
jgi:hypothetical protein